MAHMSTLLAIAYSVSVTLQATTRKSNQLKLSRMLVQLCRKLLTFPCFFILLRLQCEQSQMKSSIWPSCPSTRCGSVSLGNGTSSGTLGNGTSSGCSRTTCAYQGYDNQKILTNITTVSTCATSCKSVL